MSNNDATLPVDGQSQPQTSGTQKSNGTNKQAAAAAATGAAGIAAGAGAFAVYDHPAGEPVSEDGETVVDPVEDIDDPIGGLAGGRAGAFAGGLAGGNTGGHAGGHAGGGHTTVVPPVEPVNPPVEPVNPPVEPVDPPVKPVDPPVEPVDPPVKPVDPPVEPVDPPVKPVDPPVEPVEPIEPQIDVVENPDDIADAIIAGEEIDPDDLDSDGHFNFTEVETVYDIDGNETVEARYIDLEGNTGTMVDIDGDGLFDQWRPDEGGIIVPANEGSFLTVTDAEADAKEGYIAYNENQDPGVEDDIDISQDIIDTTDI